MPGDAPASAGTGRDRGRWLGYILILGLYLTLRGYHSFDGDQAYRLPLLLHRQNPQLYAGDPFVRAFDSFNPHRGSLLVLDLVTRPLGLPAGLVLVFVLTFLATCAGIDRLARGVWPDAEVQHVGIVAVGLFLAAKAGNIGTNHLFEAMVLDRLAAFAMGWLALAAVVVDPARGLWRAPFAIGFATLIHPSLGLQLAMVLGVSWIVWSLLGRWTEVTFTSAASGTVGLVVAVLPGLALNLGPGPSLAGDMPEGLFRLLSAELQSPQHMLPHLWRMPQWLSWGSYLALAAFALLGAVRTRPAGALLEPGRAGAAAPGAWPPARTRLVAVCAVILVGLGAAWYAIEVRHHVRLTVFQPFRMATLVRGLALIVLAGRLAILWRGGGWLGRTRAILIAVALSGDWLLVVVTLTEVAVSATEAIRTRLRWLAPYDKIDVCALLVMLGLGLNFLAHHDTEYGHIPLMSALGLGLSIGILSRWREHVRPWKWNWTAGPAWTGAALALAWLVPLASFSAALVLSDRAAPSNSLSLSFINHCRFRPIPIDDIERLAVWCRDHTPVTAGFIGPPGPKTFRLWSQRNLAFNRAASPYHGAGLADWFARFCDHVDFRGSPAEFVRAYVHDRHGFEARYDGQSDAQRAALALRQGATHVIAAAPREGAARTLSQHVAGPLELLHVEGRYAVYRVRSEALVQVHR
jgi:hypothetical protein